MDQLIDQFDLTVNKFLEGEEDQPITAGKDDNQGDDPYDPIAG